MIYVVADGDFGPRVCASAERAHEEIMRRAEVVRREYGWPYAERYLDEVECVSAWEIAMWVLAVVGIVLLAAVFIP